MLHQLPHLETILSRMFETSARVLCTLSASDKISREGAQREAVNSSQICRNSNWTQSGSKTLQRMFPSLKNKTQLKLFSWLRQKQIKNTLLV